MEIRKEVLPSEDKCIQTSILSFLDENVHSRSSVNKLGLRQTLKKRKNELVLKLYEPRFVYPCANQYRILMTDPSVQANFRHMNSGNNACVPICLLFLHWLFSGKTPQEILEKASGYMKAGIILWIKWFERSAKNCRNILPTEFIDYLNETKQNELLTYIEEETEITTNIDPAIVMKINSDEQKTLTLQEIFLKYLVDSNDAGILVIHDSAKLIFRSKKNEIFVFDPHGSRKTSKSDHCFFINLKDTDELVQFIEDLYFSNEEVFNIAAFTKIRKKTN